MIAIQNTLIGFGLLLLIAACNNSTNTNTAEPSPIVYNKLNKADWLLGTWEQKLENGTLSEHWKKLDDSTFLGKSWATIRKDTVFSERISLTQANNDLYYTPTVQGQNGGKAVPFKLTSSSDNEFVFENPNHDFPQKISVL